MTDGPDRDARLRRVVAAVDALPARGEADVLIAPMRPRLARLRPPRPITITRLLFEPVAPLIVPTATWHAGSPGIPRSSLAVLGEDLTVALGDTAEGLLARIAGHMMDDAAVVAECGSVIWAQAATLLPMRPAPTHWAAATGLPASAHAAIVKPLSALFAAGPALHRLSSLPGPGAGAEAEGLLRQAGARGAAALAMMLALLMRRMPGAHRLLRLADSITLETPTSGFVQASDRVTAFLLGDVHGAVAPNASLADAADHARHAARMLEDLEAAASAAERPGRVQMVRAARQQLAAECRERLAVGAAALCAPSPDAHAGPAAMEETARGLRRLDAVGRRLGGAEVYDRVLSSAAGQLIADRTLPPYARLRLAEILLGPDAALALFETAR